MMKMLGRLMWVAVGALGAKAWQAADEENRRGSGANNGGGTSTRSRARSRRSSGNNGS